MKRLVFVVAFALSAVPIAARAQLIEMRQTIFGMD